MTLGHPREPTSSRAAEIRGAARARYPRRSCPPCWTSGCGGRGQRCSPLASRLSFCEPPSCHLPLLHMDIALPMSVTCS